MPIALNISKLQLQNADVKSDNCLSDIKAAHARFVDIVSAFDVLDLHHKNTSKKDFGISSGGLTRSWEKVKLKADKRVLPYINCHREIHAGYKQPAWVTKQ